MEARFNLLCSLLINLTSLQYNFIHYSNNAQFFLGSHIYFESFILYTSTYLQKGFRVTFINHLSHIKSTISRGTGNVDPNSISHTKCPTLRCTITTIRLHVHTTMHNTQSKPSRQHTSLTRSTQSIPVMCDISTTQSHQHLHSKTTTNA